MQHKFTYVTKNHWKFKIIRICNYKKWSFKTGTWGHFIKDQNAKTSIILVLLYALQLKCHLSKTSSTSFFSTNFGKTQLKTFERKIVSTSPLKTYNFHRKTTCHKKTGKKMWQILSYMKTIRSLYMNNFVHFEKPKIIRNLYVHFICRNLFRCDGECRRTRSIQSNGFCANLLSDMRSSIIV